MSASHPRWLAALTLTGALAVLMTFTPDALAVSSQQAIAYLNAQHQPGSHDNHQTSSLWRGSHITP